MAMATRRVAPLSDATSARIAAAYVVPDLVVAVQEAVYNAIDAHARHVTVVVDAAQASFSVADDGDGIHPDEMFEHLFECKASSKTDRATRKYGSRGQYLVALGALAQQVELESRIATHWTSFRKVVQKGQIVFNARSKTVKTSKGTVLHVQNLFRLLPVRQRELEAHASARTRLAKRLSSFFHSISMIWPTLSLDVSFRDTKMPPCIIAGVPTCEERLRSAFGDLLGGELEYVAFDTDELPFTIRGYAAVVRDAGDGDAYLESPGWRQARAYYQFVFLDNLWLEDFQRECCKTINQAAIGMALGIPIFVLKVTSKSHEYELHSDGQTRVVNLKRPEVLMTTLRKFTEMLQSRVAEADARMAAAAVEAEAMAASHEALLGEDQLAVEVSGDAAQLPRSFDCNVSGQDDAEDAYVPGYGDEWIQAHWTEEGTEQGDLNELYGYEEDALDTAVVSDQLYSHSAHARNEYRYDVLQVHELNYVDGRATPSTVVYEAPGYTSAYDDAYPDEHSMVDPYATYYGCAHCGSCGGPKVAPSNGLDTQHQQMDQQAVYHPDHVEFLAVHATPQSLEYRDHIHHHSENEWTPMDHAAVDYEEHQWAAYELQGNVNATEYDEEGNFDEADTTENNAASASSGRQTQQQQREFDQVFFGKSLPREVSRERTNRQQREHATYEQGTKLEAAQWVSSRRVGVLETAQARFESPTAGIQHDMATNEPDESDLLCGSEQLSAYFSLEKMARAHTRSIGPAISRFAAKRTAFAGLVGSSGLDEARPHRVHVRELPQNLHSAGAKVMTLDKSMLRNLHVIKQVDRKFILVKATLASREQDESTRTLLLCIDQHAADERVRLEQLELQIFGVHGDERNVGVADHAPPLALSLNGRERDTLYLFADEIQSWGFRFERDGATQAVKLTQTPKIDTRVAGADDFREYLQLLARSDAVVARRVLRPPVITRFLHSRACRSAIMFGDYLSFSQCEDIIEQLRMCQLPFQCAHGRSSIVPLVELM